MAEEDRDSFQEAISGFELLVDGRLLPWGEFCRDLRAWLLDTGQVPVEGKLANSPCERELSRRPSLVKREHLEGDMAEEDRELFQEAICGFEVSVFGQLLQWGEFCRELRAFLLETGQFLSKEVVDSTPKRRLRRRFSLARREHLAGDIAEEDRDLFQEAISGFEVSVFGPLLPWGGSFAASCVPGCWMLVRPPLREDSRAAPARES
ncbi:unnamed protein product [Prorocentrum cordatum]|uniref:Uncharacterized protein n=1 Tax=Prorocentrum cordatum TaxID=2364126 RepID=A0ABN9W4U7_9DINO|nr:unnamed protein product [Polarella glacialis]